MVALVRTATDNLNYGGPARVERVATIGRLPPIPRTSADNVRDAGCVVLLAIGLAGIVVNLGWAGLIVPLAALAFVMGGIAS